MSNAGIEISPCFFEQPIAQSPRRMFYMTTNAKLGESRRRFAAMNAAACFTLAREYEAMNLTT
jgi:hypothetical protein